MIGQAPVEPLAHSRASFSRERRAACISAILASSSAISINQLTSTGNDLLTQINKLAIPANEILNKANQGDGTLGRIINDESLYKSLDGAVNDTRATMTRLQTTIDKINKGQGSAGKLVNDPELYDSLNKTVSHLEAISADIKAGRGSTARSIGTGNFAPRGRSGATRVETLSTGILCPAGEWWARTPAPCGQCPDL